MGEDDIMTFGKYKGKKLGEIPAGYFLYIYDRGWAKGELKKFIEEFVPVLRTKYLSRTKSPKRL